LHGGGQSRRSCQSTAVSLTAAGWVTVAMDARGHGASDWASDADYRTSALVADLEAVVATRSPTRRWWSGRRWAV
jgi:alpha-beta hydrolase superfamily lysophospholipase